LTHTKQQKFFLARQGSWIYKNTVLYPRLLMCQEEFCCFICVSYGPYTLL